MKRKLPTKMWAGFIDGKMDVNTYYSAVHGAYGLVYPTKKAAMGSYADVRRIEIREAKTKRK